MKFLFCEMLKNFGLFMLFLDCLYRNLKHYISAAEQRKMIELPKLGHLTLENLILGT